MSKRPCSNSPKPKRKETRNLKNTFIITKTKQIETLLNPKITWNTIIDKSFFIRDKFYIDNAFDEEHSEQFLKDKMRCLKKIELNDEIIPSKKEGSKGIKIPEKLEINKTDSRINFSLSKKSLLSFTFRNDEK